MTGRPANQPAEDVTIKVGMIVLATTVSSVVWWHILLWLWNWAARQGWWDPAADGARVIAAILAVAVTWIIWGRVSYWLTMPDTEGIGTERTGSGIS